MAGGINAAVVPCLRCVGPAQRTAEGLENDYYECAECGFSFGIDWAYDGPPRKPCWPISAEDAERRRKEADHMFRTVLKEHARE